MQYYTRARMSKGRLQTNRLITNRLITVLLTHRNYNYIVWGFLLVPTFSSLFF